MKSMGKDILKKLRRAETRLKSLNQELERLESEKQRYLQEMVKGAQLFTEVKRAGQVIKKKRLAISKAKREVSNLRAQWEGQLAEFKRILIAEKQKELNDYMQQRAGYLKRIEELELEISRYRYLVTGKKDRRLANVKDPLPLEIGHQDNLVSIDEVIGHIKLEIHRITRMSSAALLKEYVVRGRKGGQTNRSRI